MATGEDQQSTFRCSGIFLAARNGDVIAIRRYLKEGVRLDIVDKDGWSPLHHALLFRRDSVVKMIRNIISAQSETKLSETTQSSHSDKCNPCSDVARSLTANIDSKLAVGDIFEAARCGDISAVCEFLDLGVPVDLEDERGWSPVHYAIASQQSEMVSLLIGRGSNLTSVKTSTCSVNSQFAVKSAKEMADGEREHLNNSGCDNIFEAARKGDFTLVESMLEHGVPVNVRDDRGWCPVHYAVAHRQVKVVSLLIERGSLLWPLSPSVRRQGNAGNSHVKSNMHSYQCLISDAFDNAKSGNAIVLSEMLESDLQSDTVDARGRTMLHHAAAYAHLDACNVLINKGCGVEVVDHDGWTPGIHAWAKGHARHFPRLLKLLAGHVSTICLSSTREVVDKISTAIECGDADSVCKYLDSGGSMYPAGVSVKSLSLLHLASSAGFISCVRLLLQRGCVANARDLNRLHRAAFGTAFGSGTSATAKKLLNCTTYLNCLDSENETPLIKAVRNENLSVIRVLVSHDPNSIDFRNTEGRTALHYAAWLGYLKSFSLLLKLGASLSVVDLKQNTPYHFAIITGQLAIVRNVISASHNLVFKDPYEKQPIHLAALYNRPEILKFLLSVGANINARDKNGWNALHLAANAGHVETLALLIRLGGNVNDFSAGNGTCPAGAEDHLETLVLLICQGRNLTDHPCNGYTPLMVAIISKKLDSVKELVKHSRLEINIVNENTGLTALHYAAFIGITPIVRLLLANGARKSMTKSGHSLDDNAGTPLHSAIATGNPHLIPLFLNEGCPATVTDRNGITLLHHAARFGQVETMKLLYDKGLSLSSSDVEGRTPLHKAAAAGHVAAVRWLLDKGCDINCVDFKGKTPLSRAMANEKHLVMKELAKHGDLNFTLVDSKGLTSLHYVAMDDELVESARTLMNIGGKKALAVVAGEQGSPLHQAAAYGSTEIVKAFLKAGCPVDVRDPRGVPVIHVAAEYGFVDIIETLAQHMHGTNMDVNMLGNEGMTALHVAVQRNQIEALRKLTSHGGLNLPDAYGLNVYEYILIRDQTPRRVHKFCLACGVDLKSTNLSLADIVHALVAKHLINWNRILCLAVAAGNLLLLADLFDTKLPLTQQKMSNMVQYVAQKTVSNIDSSLETFCVPGKLLNPLHIALVVHRLREDNNWGSIITISMQQLCAVKLLQNQHTQYTALELFPNGLSPLDAAREFGLHEIANLIMKAGGKPGIWSDIPKQITQKCIHLLHQLKDFDGSEQELILALAAGFKVSKSSARRHNRRNIMKLKPTLAEIDTIVLNELQAKCTWKQVGRQLRLPDDVLDIIEQTSSQNGDAAAASAYLSMLEHWLKHGQNVSWMQLIKALKQTEPERTVTAIKENIAQKVSLSENLDSSRNSRPSQQQRYNGHRSTPESRSAGAQSSTEYYIQTLPAEVKTVSDLKGMQWKEPVSEDAIWSLIGRNIHASWNLFAIHLGVRSNVVDDVHQQVLGNCEHAFKKICRLWLSEGEGTGQHTREWHTVLEAIRQVENPQLAREVELHLKT